MSCKTKVPTDTNSEVWRQCNQRWSTAKLSPRKEYIVEGPMMTSWSLASWSWMLLLSLTAYSLDCHFCRRGNWKILQHFENLGGISSEISKGQEQLRILSGFKSWPVSKGMWFHGHPRNATMELQHFEAWMSPNILGSVGGVCNFFNSALSQQKFEATDQHYSSWTGQRYSSWTDQCPSSEL